LYGWRSDDYLFRTLGHDDILRFTLLIHPNPRSGWADVDEGPRANGASLIITLVIGWYESCDGQMSVVDTVRRDVWSRAVVYALARLDMLGELDNKIKFTPYLEDGQHRFCFPAQNPRTVEWPNCPYPAIEFESPCNCGMGDRTGSKFKYTGTCTVYLTLTRALFGQYGKSSKLLFEFGCKTDQKGWANDSLYIGLSQDTHSPILFMFTRFLSLHMRRLG
jgi:hypothetical protein